MSHTHTCRCIVHCTGPYTMYNVKYSVCKSIIQWFAKEFPNYRHLQNLHSKEGASRTRGLGGRVRHEMSRSKIISRQWPLVVHLSRGLVGWSQVVWLGNGHKAVTVQGPRRPLLRSVLNPYLGTPATTTSGWPAPHQLSNISNHCPTKTNFSSTALQRPGCSQNCSSSLSLLLPARTSIFASIDSFCALTPNINTFSPLLNSMHSRCQRERVSLYVRRAQLCLLWEVDPPWQVWGSFVLRHEGVKIFFIRQNQRKPVPKGQRSSSCCTDYLWMKFL